MQPHPGSLAWKRDLKRGYALMHHVEPTSTVVELPVFGGSRLQWRAWWKTWKEFDLACRRARLQLTKDRRVYSMK